VNAVRPRVIRSDFAHLPAAVARVAAHARVVGFDVFDTLLRRRIEPEAVKDRVAAELAHRLGAPDWRPLREARAALERALHAERLAARDGEFTLAELMPRWLAAVAPARRDGADLAGALLAYEIELERRAVAPTPGIAAVLAALQAAGRRLLFVSDMYLDAAQIWTLLAAADLEHHFAAGYLSCEHGCRKGTGRLFRLVLAREGLRPDELAFVGNTWEVDVEPARRLGVRVVHVRDHHEHKRRRRLQVAEWAAPRHPLWAGHRALEIVESLPARVEAGRSPHYDLGLVLAPVFVAFVLHVIERTRADRFREVYFLSREGWFLQRLYRRLVRALGLAGRVPRGRYLFASRLATFLPSMQRLDWPELHRMWRQYDRQSLRLLLANLQLPEDELAPLAAAAGVADLDALLADPEHDPAFRRFLAHPEVQARFTAHRDAARALLRAYLAQIGVLGREPVAFVDVGWKGSIQANVCRAFADDPAFPVVHGLYLGSLPAERPARATFSGFLADGRTPDARLDRIFATPTPFEMAATAAHGSVARYARPARRGGRVVPVLITHEAERAHAAALHDVRRAIDDWVEDFVGCLGLVEPSAATLRLAAADRVLRHLCYPTAREAAVFADYVHVESFGVRGVTRFDAGRPRLLRAAGPRRLWREFWGRVDAEFWPELALRRAGLALVHPLAELRRLLRATA
jgi:FMN phosphatase YigB (HAD superfamily)